MAVTISDFVVSGINPFTGGSVTLNACDADLDPFNGCFDVDIFSTPLEDCAGIPGGSAVVDECGECGGDGYLLVFPMVILIQMERLIYWM